VQVSAFSSNKLASPGKTRHEAARTALPRRQQNALAAAIKEYGALRRTVYAARYLADEMYRRRVARQLNKGENQHALKRSLAYAGEGALSSRQPADHAPADAASRPQPHHS
jgi:TnpA family transposase